LLLTAYVRATVDFVGVCTEVSERPSDNCLLLSVSDGSGAIEVIQGCETTLTEVAQEAISRKGKYVRVSDSPQVDGRLKRGWMRVS